MKGKVLLISGDEAARAFWQEMLDSEGFVTILAVSARESAQTLRQDHTIDAALLDQPEPGMGGLEILDEIRSDPAAAQVIIISSSSDPSSAVTAMRMGAFEYLHTPVDRERAVLCVNLAVKMTRLARENSRLIAGVRKRITLDSIAGASQELADAKEKARLLAPLDAPALIYGEPGSGCAMLAEAIHNEGPRAGGPFVTAKINGENGEGAQERLLFGCEMGEGSSQPQEPERGCLEKASGGTLYLRDIARLSPKLQAALLGVLQRGEFFRIGGYHPVRTGFRLIASSGVGLEEETRAGRFREDLYFRINVTPIHIPPLRKRRDDIHTLAGIFLARLGAKYDKPGISISPEAMGAMAKYRWPGNVRELMETIEGLVAQSQSGAVSFSDLPDRIYKDARRPARQSRHEAGVGPYAVEKMEFERRYLIRALEECEGNITVMARITDLSRPALYEKLRKHGLK